MYTSLLPVDVFYSYADADVAWLNELEKHLSLLRREGFIKDWHKRNIAAGTDWKKTLDQHLNTASVILLLISVDFVASDYCYGVEVQRAMERHKAGEAKVIPILLRPIDWQSALFAQLQPLPSNGVPVARWEDRDEAFVNVAQGLRKILCKTQHPALGAPSTILPYIWNVPYAPNPFFTGREQLLGELAETLQASPQPQAISGLGGIGKTQIAVAYAYRHQEDYQVVLWARGETIEALNTSYTEIARLLNLPQQNAQEQKVIVQAVKAWLRREGGWLLILDNVDDLNMVQTFLPNQYAGHLLLTTRAQTTGKLARRLEVDTLNCDMGALLLLRRSGLITQHALLDAASASDQLMALALTEELGGLPLALDQAGAYIEETQCSLSDYQQRYQKRRVEVLALRGALVDDHPDSVATTWSLSFQKIEQANPAAADLLRLCAFLHPDDIPIEMITESACNLGSCLAALNNDPFAFDKAIATLGAYSLLRRTASNGTLSIHRLVQAVQQDNLSEQERKKWTTRVIAAVNMGFPQKIENAPQRQCERYIQHALICAARIEQENLFDLEGALLLNRVGQYLRNRARYQEAERVLQRSLAIQEELLGLVHPYIVHILHELAHLYYRWGKYKQAELLYEREVEIWRMLSDLIVYIPPSQHERDFETYSGQLYIEQHLGMIMALNGLADTYRTTGKFEKALASFQQAYAIHESLGWIEHPSIAYLFNNWGLLYMDMGDNEKAKPLVERALAIRKNLLSEEDTAITDSLNTLAELYRRQGQNEKAASLLRQVLEIDEKAHGLTHPDVAIDLNSLAEHYRTTGKDEQAEPLYLRALVICEECAIPDHIITATILNNLGLLYCNQGEYRKAEPLLLRAFAIWENQLGFLNLNTARSLHNIGWLYDNQKRYGEAESWYLQALTIRRQIAPYDLNTALNLNNLGLVYCAQGKYTEAKPLILRALAIREKQLGPYHLTTMESRTNLMLVQSQEKQESSEKSYQREVIHRKARSRMVKQSRKKNRGR